MSRNYDTNCTFATTSKIRVTKLRHESLSCHYQQNSCHKITTRMFVLPLRAKFVSQNYDTNFTFATTSKIRVTKLRHESLSCHYQQNSCHEITTRMFVLPLQAKLSFISSTTMNNYLLGQLLIRGQQYSSYSLVADMEKESSLSSSEEKSEPLSLERSI